MDECPSLGIRRLIRLRGRGSLFFRISFARWSISRPVHTIRIAATVSSHTTSARRSRRTRRTTASVDIAATATVAMTAIPISSAGQWAVKASRSLRTKGIAVKITATHITTANQRVSDRKRIHGILQRVAHRLHPSTARA